MQVGVDVPMRHRGLHEPVEDRLTLPVANRRRWAGRKPFVQMQAGQQLLCEYGPHRPRFDEFGNTMSSGLASALNARCRPASSR